MSRVYVETEHQELFYPHADLHQPIPIHIPSALGPLGYVLYVRVPEAAANVLRGAGVAIEVGGLRPDSVTLDFGGGLSKETPTRSADRKVWVPFCRAKVSRGDGTLAFRGIPPDLPRADILLCTWPRFVASGQADSWLACQQDPRWAPNGVPLGGIGCGKVEFSRDGRFRNFSGNNNQDMPLEEPDGLDGAGLSVALGGEERLLATRAARGLAPCPHVEIELAFPQARVKAVDVFPGLDAEVLLSGPVVPHDPETSSLPGFLARWTLRNRRADAVRVRPCLAWPNLVGVGGGIAEPEKQLGYADGFYQFREAPEEQRADVLRPDGMTVLRYANAPGAASKAADGFHYAAVKAPAGAVNADPRRGSVGVEVDLAAGATATVLMAVVWEMPHGIDTLLVDRGHYWQTLCRDGVEILQRLFHDADRILRGAGELNALLDATELPAWLRRRLANACYPLVTNSVFYRDGRFSINEGPTEMAGCYGTLDQRLGAHPATQLLFPALNAKELGEFAAVQSPNGGVNHDLGAGHLERGAADQGWPDLTCSFILQHARHAWTTGDAAFEADAWRRARRALLRHAEWAEEGGGVAQVGYGLGTSYDGYHYYGTTPYMATLWLAALAVCRSWAAQHRDGELIKRIDGWQRAAVERMDADLWNGEYYRAYKSAQGAVNENSHAGMLAGEYYARLLAGVDVLPPERLGSCAEALLRLNGSENFAVPPDEVRPDGSEGSEYGWLPYVECFGVAPLALLKGRRVLPLWERMIRCMTDDGRCPCDTRLMYRPSTGEPSWGAYYMTAPASWIVYDALLDFFYAPAEARLRLVPSIEGSFAVVHPLFWAIGRRAQRGHVDALSLTVKRVFSTSPLEIAVIEAPAAAAIHMHGHALPKAGEQGVYSRYTCTPFVLTEGAHLEWEVRRPAAT